MRPHLEELSAAADTLICAYPNAGLPNESGQYDESPAYMARLIGEFARDGLVNVVGGCCGTTPEHIAAIAASVAPHKPREVWLYFTSSAHANHWVDITESIEQKRKTLRLAVGRHDDGHALLRHFG